MKQYEKKTILVLMAIFKSTAFSKMRKSFGNLTTCEHKGQQIVREKVDEVKNPNTPAQQKQRKRFPTLVQMADAFAPAIALGLKNCKKEKHTVENYFVHLNRAAVTASEEAEGEIKISIDFSKLLISNGNRNFPENVSATLNEEERNLLVTFETEEQDEYVNHSEAEDVFYCCVLEKTRMRTKLMRIGERRNLTEFTMTFPQKWEVKKDNLAVYLFCTSKDGANASKTVYVDLA